jgi:hypothetical protein
VHTVGAVEVRRPARRAIQGSIISGTRLTTPARGAPFTVAKVDDRGVVLLFGAKETPTPFSWSSLEGAVEFLRGKGWVTIGGVYDTGSTPGTLDSYLKGYMKRATAGWVAALFEAAGLVQLDRRPPSRVRLVS